MKIQCDVCNKDEASVFCSADEAALCNACDHRVHHANKLAEKHHRFSLLHPSPKQFPLCDICQEKKAFLFCQQDRAILCGDCDVPIHKVNEHTQKHNRFLLTGVKLSATSALYSPFSATISSDSVPDLKSPKSSDKPSFSVLSAAIPNPPPPVTTTVDGGGGGGCTSSISEYLIETLPGWHVEDFLDSSPPPFGFSKNVDENVLTSIWDTRLENNLTCISSENTGIWVPQGGPPPQNASQLYPYATIAFGGGQTGSIEATPIKSCRTWRDDGGFTVPQISPPANASKRSGIFW